MTPLKLIKLAYICHGFHLAYFAKPIFEDKVEAWQYGPVVPRVYFSVNHFGRAPIREGLFAHVDDPISSDALKIVNGVVKSYNQFDGLQLSTLTHEPNTPWDITVKKHGVDSVIPNTLIKKHYDRVINGGS